MWMFLDQQLARDSARLLRDVRVPAGSEDHLASVLADESHSLSDDFVHGLLSEPGVPLTSRLEELKAFQGWMDVASTVASPVVTRAQVLTQLYFCFVYLQESLYRELKNHATTGGALHRCARYLSDNPVRALRNAVAHGNWHYRTDFKALVFYARKGTDPNEPVCRWEVEQAELDFWQRLARTVAYVVMTVASERTLETRLH